jgi:hypothetical protein
VTIDRPTILYVLHDKRSPVPDWLRASFYDTGDEIGIDHPGLERLNYDVKIGVGPGVSIDDTLSIWRRDVPTAGTVTLGAIRMGGERHNMYGIVAVPLGLPERNDDFAGSTDHPSRGSTAIAAGPGGELSIAGAIEQPGDNDAFSFQWTGGLAQVVCQSSPYATLDPVVKVFDGNETLVGYAQADRKHAQDASVLMNLPAGPYYAIVAGSDEPGEVGYYRLAITPATGEVLPHIPPSPSLALNAEAKANGIDFSWNALPHAESYTLEKSIDAVSFRSIATTNTTSAVDSDIVRGRPCIYRVCANIDGERAASAPLQVHARPTAVSHLQTFGLSPTSIVVDWHDVAGETGYRIDRSTDGKKYGTIATLSQNDCGYRDESVEPGNKYFYRVATLVGRSKAAQSARVAALSGVGGLSAKRDEAGVALKWQPGYPHERVALERAIGCGQFTPIALLNRDTGNFVDKPADLTEKLRYRIVAVEDGKDLNHVKSGKVETIRLPDAIDADYFALRFNGKIRIKKPDRYTFYLDSDDGSRLFIDGAVVVDNDGRHPHQKVSGEINLAAGLHELELHYFEYFGHNVLNLSWSRAGTQETRVPASVLSSVIYQYYKGDWSYLPFNKAIAMSDVVTLRVPSPKDGSENEK